MMSGCFERNVQFFGGFLDFGLLAEKIGTPSRSAWNCRAACKDAAALRLRGTTTAWDAAAYFSMTLR